MTGLFARMQGLKEIPQGAIRDLALGSDPFKSIIESAKILTGRRYLGVGASLDLPAAKVYEGKRFEWAKASHELVVLPATVNRGKGSKKIGSISVSVTSPFSSAPFDWEKSNVFFTVYEDTFLGALPIRRVGGDFPEVKKILLDEVSGVRLSAPISTHNL